MGAHNETKAGLSSAELVFARRMLPHFMAGRSAAEAAAAVLDDDARLFEAYCEQSHAYFVDVGEGYSARTRMGRGDVIAKGLTEAVYERLSAEARATSETV